VRIGIRLGEVETIAVFFTQLTSFTLLIHRNLALHMTREGRKSHVLHQRVQQRTVADQKFLTSNSLAKNYLVNY
jgi:hypothetical protein